MKGSTQESPQTVRQKIGWYGWKACLYILAYLPLPLLHLMGACAATFYFGFSDKAAKKLKSTLNKAGFIHRYRQVVAEQGKMLLETPYIHLRKRLPLEVKNLELVKNNIHSNGTLFLVPHFAGFEVILRPLIDISPTITMYKPAKYVLANILNVEARQTNGAILAPTNQKGVKMLLKGLKNNQHVAILPDQVPEKEAGEWAPFFGTPAYTTTLPVRLFEKTHCRILLASAIRKPRGKGFLIEFFDWNELMPNQALTVSTLNLAIEKIINQAPEQYLWSYNRYKAP
jgi:KDO2-lipid IV(A) lauroyltransferase